MERGGDDVALLTVAVLYSGVDSLVLTSATVELLSDNDDVEEMEAWLLVVAVSESRVPSGIAISVVDGDVVLDTTEELGEAGVVIW